MQTIFAFRAQPGGRAPVNLTSSPYSYAEEFALYTQGAPWAGLPTLQNDEIKPCPLDQGISLCITQPTAPTMLANVGRRMGSECRYNRYYQREDSKRTEELNEVRVRLGTDKSAIPPPSESAPIWMNAMKDPNNTNVVRGQVMTLDCAMDTLVLGTMTGLWHLNRNFPEKYHGLLLHAPEISSLTEYNELSLLNKLICEWNISACDGEDGLVEGSASDAIVSKAIKTLRNTSHIVPYQEVLEKEWIAFQHNYSERVKVNMYERFCQKQDILVAGVLEFCKNVFCFMDMGIKENLFPEGVAAIYDPIIKVNSLPAAQKQTLPEQLAAFEGAKTQIPTMFLHWMMEVAYNGPPINIGGIKQLLSPVIGEPLRDFVDQDEDITELEGASGEGARHLSLLLYQIKNRFWEFGNRNFFGFEFGARYPDRLKPAIRVMQGKGVTESPPTIPEDLKQKVINAFASEGNPAWIATKKKFARMKIEEIEKKTFDIKTRIICGDNYVQSFLDYVRYTWLSLRSGFRGTGGFRDQNAVIAHNKLVQEVNASGVEDIPEALLSPKFDCKTTIQGNDEKAAILPYIHYNFAHFYAYNLQMEKLVVDKLKNGRVSGNNQDAHQYATPLAMLSNISPNEVPMRSTSYDLSYYQGEPYLDTYTNVENTPRVKSAFDTCYLNSDILDTIQADRRAAEVCNLVNAQLDSLVFLKNLMGVKYYEDVTSRSNNTYLPAYRSSLFTVDIPLLENYYQGDSFKDDVLRNNMKDFPRSYPKLETLKASGQKEELKQERKRILENWEQHPLFLYSHKIPRPHHQGYPDSNPYMAVFEKRNIEAMLQRCYFLGDMFQLMVASEIAMFSLDDVTFFNAETKEHCVYTPVSFCMNESSVRDGFGGVSDSGGHFWAECKLPAYFGSSFRPILDKNGREVQDVRAFEGYLNDEDETTTLLYSKDGTIWHHCDNMLDAGTSDWDLLVDEYGNLLEPHGGVANPPATRKMEPKYYPSNYRPVHSDKLSMRMIKENMVSVGAITNQETSVQNGKEYRPYKVKIFENGTKFLIFQPGGGVNIESVVYAKTSAYRVRL